MVTPLLRAKNVLRLDLDEETARAIFTFSHGQAFYLKRLAFATGSYAGMTVEGSVPMLEGDNGGDDDRAALCHVIVVI
jgi:hypothetical protein